jgi:transposase
MVYRKISADIKCRALQLLAEGWELGEIANVLGVSEKSVDHWLHNYEAHGRVDPPSVNRGRRRLLTQDVIGDIQELLLETPDLYLNILQVGRIATTLSVASGQFLGVARLTLLLALRVALILRSYFRVWSIFIIGLVLGVILLVYG